MEHIKLITAWRSFTGATGNCPKCGHSLESERRNGTLDYATETYA